MNKKTRKKAQTQARQEPTPKTKIPDSSSADASTPKNPKGDAVSVTDQYANKSTHNKGDKMSEIRWTDKLITFATIVIAADTIVQGYELVTGSRDTHDLAVAALAANRAWIAPEQIILTSPVESGLPLKYQIRITNPGKEPALDAISKVTPIGVPYIHEDVAEDSV
jgi:hypothetical protein